MMADQGEEATESSAPVCVRSKTALWLLGCEDSELRGSKLPSNRQVLRVFFHHHRSLKKTVRQSATTVIRETVMFWEKAKIPVRPEQHAIAKLEKLHEKWIKLKKNANRKTDKQQANETEFIQSLDNVFDMAHMDAMTLIKIPEDKQFLLAQREPGRRGCMGQVDKIYALKELKAAKRKKSSVLFKQRTEQERQMLNESVTLELSSTDNDTECEGDIGEGHGVDNVWPTTSTSSCSVVESAKPVSKRKRATINIVTPDVAAALDRAKVSDRKAALLITATAQSLGHNADDLTINRSSIHRSRERCRVNLNAHLKEQFMPTVPLVVHWDGKLLSDLTGKEMVDRLPVILSGAGVNQVIGVPKLPVGTGEAQAYAVAHLLDEWGVTDRVAAMCFDTTSSNTGHIKGACVLLEQKLKKELLHLACRHHVFELVLASVFKECMGVSSGPDVSIFKRFQESWKFIDQMSYESGASNYVVAEALREGKDILIAFTLDQLLVNQPRDDYRELLELALIFIGEVPPRGVRFIAPGAIHHARWMAKALYSLKIWLFRGQFHLTDREDKGLRDICIFVVRMYITVWFTAPLAISAPFNDLKFIQSLVNYKQVNQAVCKATSDKFSGHLWYLCEELVGLAFYDPLVSTESKREMVKALVEKDGMEEPPKRIHLDIWKARDEDICEMRMEHFVTKNTLLFFQRLSIPTGFLFECDPAIWEDNVDYQRSNEMLKELKVVNDSAERGVALIEEYNSILTRKENQKQYLLKVVQDHRRRFPNFNKGTLTAASTE